MSSCSDTHCPTGTTGHERGLHATAAGGGRIAAISAHIRQHLARDHQIPPGALIDLPSGVTDSDWQHSAAPGMPLLPPPARTGFMLAMGRAQPYKGFDDLLDALALLQARQISVPHTLIAAVTEDAQPSGYQRHLARRVTAGQLNATLITRFAPELRTLLAHPALAAVVLSSRAEPFGRIPLPSCRLAYPPTAVWRVRLFLTGTEAAALGVLLMAEFGWNLSVIDRAGVPRGHR
jgi:glycosyltransferase involved in cell wall biosynthesis